MSNVKQRQAIEKRIVASAIADLLEANFLITVNDGDEDVLERSDDPEKIAAAMMSTDEDYLFVFANDNPTTTRAGWVRFIYGNVVLDVMYDKTTNVNSSLHITT